MKFFSELGLCWSGALVTPPPDPAEVRRCTVEHGVSHRRRTAKRPTKLAGHWKPKLNAISENSPVSEAANGGGIRRNDDHKKRPVKANPKSPAKTPTPSGLTEDYWSLSHTMVLPAFSPTSYLF